MNPIVSIILTSYNKPLLVGKTIESVIAQTFTEWELYIMDDHSNKETVKVIQRYLNDPRIHYINSGIKHEDRYKSTRYASLINMALPLTKGTYFSYLTDDTIYLPERLEEMVRFLESNPSVDIVYSSQQVNVVNHQLHVVQEFTRHANKVLSDAANIVDHCSVMHTRHVLQQVFTQFGEYWSDDPIHWCNGDAIFWSRLNGFQPFYPINKVLDITFKTPFSVQSLFRDLPKVIPNGTLVKGSDKYIYMIDEQKRRLIPEEMFTDLKFNPLKVVEIPDPILFKYKEGIPVNKQNHLPNFRLFRDQNGIIFYMEHNQKRRIKDRFVLRKFKFDQNEMIQVETKWLDQFPNGLDIHSSLLYNEVLPENRIFKYHHQYWITCNQTLCPVGKNILSKLNLLKESISVSKKELEKFKLGNPLSSL